MVQFTRLRLSGFKSFVDATDVPVESGLTGVVGPNGCGKSNLVEALRWVMGESSAKQMRGSEMDDVIFGGTSTRPPRNIAEVMVGLDNRDRTAPAQFNEFDELEVVRRIERGSGSMYKVNGKEVRARDVQLLFADSATGARSTAMVSQGRIGALISAKPADRRSLLEEAAGIGGLHSRRHEAEQRLQAAEVNLGRVDDVVVALDAQAQSLRRQCKQAARYRSLSEQIRLVEAQVLLLQWGQAIRGLEAARTARRHAEVEVGRLTAEAAHATTEQLEAAGGVPGRRQAEVEAAARYQRLQLEREQLDQEEQRVSRARHGAQTRLRQADEDLQRETARAADADQSLARLHVERQGLHAAQQDEPAQLAVAKTRLDEATAEVARRDHDVAALTEQVAAIDAERAAAARRVVEAESRRRKAEERDHQAQAQARQAEADSVPADALAQAAHAAEAARLAVESARAAAESARARLDHAAAARDAAREALQTEAAARARLRAEAQGLQAVLAEPGKGTTVPVLNALRARPGYEGALGAALGDDLSAPADAPAPRHWLSLAPLPDAPALPAGVEPLSDFVEAPAALGRRLAQVGVVDSGTIGTDLRHDLKAGQRLVSRDGALWRWDGYTVAAGAPSAAAAKLRQMNRLVELNAQIAAADTGVAAAETGSRDAAAAAESATQAERAARDAVRAAETNAGQARDALARLQQKAAAAAQRLAGLAEQAERLAADLTEAQAAEAAARAAAGAGADGAAHRERINALRAELAERRSALVEARSFMDRLTRDSLDRKRRVDALAGEIAAWGDRAQASGQQRQDLADRREQAARDIARLDAVPAQLAAKRQVLLSSLATADTARKAAAAQLADAESRLHAADRALKAAEHALAAAREDDIRREAQVEAGSQACRTVSARIAERYDLTADQLRAETPTLADPSELDELQRKLDRVMREREGMGPVNLRAEAEAAELEDQLTTLKNEREDLIAAIAKFRQAIGELNREGRERLLASFQQVDEHFRTLFVRLFGGGRAHLTLTESDDPLAAGLEIMASPPGKRLQVLSLLSGGEQALTALALLFAVFMTNPAPICVMDEVDAPLDDANVDRFCTLVGEIAASSKTRFLIITHHRMTMARMDRLFGVTMAERGISTLVSVDLEAAAALREPA